MWVNFNLQNNEKMRNLSRVLIIKWRGGYFSVYIKVKQKFKPGVNMSG